ncbi:MAG: PAS domain S-box protein [Bacteroidales bacterium]|nr:PAS domain S-box protein [Bacteroidales bacterium]
MKLEAENKLIKSKLKDYKKKLKSENFKEKLEYEYNQKKLIVNISKILNKNKNFRKALDKTVKLIGEHTKVSRVYIIEDFEYGKYCRSSHEWCNTGISAEKDNLQKIDYSEIPSFKPLIIEKGVLNISDIDELPDDLKDILKPQNVKATLLIPLFVNNLYFGNIGFDECITYKNWQTQEINFLKIIVNIISSAFEKEIFVSKLKDSNNRFKAFSRATFEAIIICFDNEIIDLNYKARQLTKYTKEELLKLKITDLFKPNENQEIYNSLNSDIEIITEKNLIRKDKKIIPVEIENKNFQYNKRKVKVIAIRDISERKKAAILIKENQEKYRTIVETANDAIIILEYESANIADVNKKAEKLFKAKKEDLIGLNRNKMHPKDEINNNSNWFNDLDYWLKNTVKSSIIDKKGKIIPVEISSSEINIDKQKFIIGFFRDITIQNDYEKILLKAKNKAEESEKLKSAFLSNISHEIRTPMNGIIGFANLLKTPDIEEEKRVRYLEIIENSSNQLLNLISDIIDLSKFEAGIINLNKEKVNINQLILELYQFFKEGILSRAEKQIYFYYETQFIDDDIFVYTDYMRLKQILINLIGNALKFTYKGFVKFGYTIKKNPKTSFLEFFVEDTGIGIQKDKQKIIFQRFRQAESSTSKNFGGTGLGLNISRILVKKLGGNIKVEAEESKGSIFTFTIPFIQKPENIFIEKNKCNFKNRTILIIENEAENAAEIGEILKPTKIETLFAFSIEDALIIIKAIAKIDIVLINIDMEGIKDNCTSLKIKKIRKSIPIISQNNFDLNPKSKSENSKFHDAQISKQDNNQQLISTINKFLR